MWCNCTNSSGGWFDRSFHYTETGEVEGFHTICSDCHNPIDSSKVDAELVPAAPEKIKKLVICDF